MGWPIDSQHTVFMSGATRIGNVFLGAIQSGITALYAGAKTISRITVDGQGGNASGLAASGAIKATGNIESTSGAVMAPTVQASGNVLGAKLASVAGGTGLEFRSGTQVYAYQAFAVGQVSGSSLIGVLSVPVASGRAALIEARGVGTRANFSGSVASTVTGSFDHLNGNGTIRTLVPNATATTIGFPSGHPGSIAFDTGNSGTVLVSAIGGSGAINWTVFANVTISP